MRCLLTSKPTRAIARVESRSDQSATFGAWQPRHYQAAALRWISDTPIGLLALPMGAGKTVIALSAISQWLEQFEVSKVLIVAPLRVAELVWAQEAGKWDHTSHLTFASILGAANERREVLRNAQADVYLVNRENFAWLVEEVGAKAWPWDCVIIDENRGFKDRASRSWKALKKVRDRIDRLYILTGTPAPNSLLELWPQVSILDRGQRLGRTLTGYRERWFLPDKRNRHIVYSWRLKPGAADEIYSLLADCMFSVDADQQLPERIDNVVRVRPDLAGYRELEREMVLGTDVMAVNSAVLAGKLAQLSNGAVYTDDGGVREYHTAKLDALEEIADQGEPVLVLITYRHDWSRIKARFPKAEKFDGAQSLARWQAGTVSMLVMHPASGGHGVDGLQLGGRVAVWFGLPFSLDLYQQACARLHRSGQRQSVVIHHLVAEGTIDERIMQVLQTKGDMQAALLAAVREVVDGKS